MKRKISDYLPSMGTKRMCLYLIACMKKEDR